MLLVSLVIIKYARLFFLPSHRKQVSSHFFANSKLPTIFTAIWREREKFFMKNGKTHLMGRVFLCKFHKWIKEIRRKKENVDNKSYIYSYKIVNVNIITLDCQQQQPPRLEDCKASDTYLCDCNRGEEINLDNANISRKCNFS